MDKTLAERVSNIESIEDLFAIFRLDFDQHAVKVHRLHMLKLFGKLVAEIDEKHADLGEEDRWTYYASALLQAHDRYATGDPSASGAPLFPGVQGLVQLRIKRPPT